MKFNPGAANKRFEDEFLKFVEDHRDGLFDYVSRRVASTEEAEDVTAKILCDALGAWRKKVPDDKRVWIYSIARKRVNDSWRKHRRKGTMLRYLDQEATAKNDGFAHWNQSQSLHQLRIAIHRLPALQREALLLKAIEDLSVQDIARVMHKSPAAVSSLLQRARANLNDIVTLEEVLA